jgi:hypothetical protein
VKGAEELLGFTYSRGAVGGLEGFDLASLASGFPGEIDWLLTDRPEAPIPEGTVIRVEHDCEWNNARVLEDVVPDTGFSKAVLAWLCRAP